MRRAVSPLAMLSWLALSTAACGTLPLEPETGGVVRPDGGAPSGRTHPLDWAVPSNHGLAAKMQEMDCRLCHGPTLEGGGSAPVGCDGCHASGWRTNCTYCHGGTDNALGSPPRDLGGETARARTTFPAHTAHVTASARHLAFDCTQCHVKPADVLSLNHMFDDTPGRSEVVFGAGLSPRGTYGSGTCSSSYCHGNGRDSNGSVAVSAGPMSCASCHPASGLSSGRHRKHAEEGVACYECHGGTVNQRGDEIIDASLHVNGRVDLKFPTALVGFTFSNRSCTGFCHFEGHRGETW